MAKFRVVKTYEIEADTASEAKTAAGELVMTTVRAISEDDEGQIKIHPATYYQQTLATLDIVWDRYMDQSIADIDLRTRVNSEIDPRAPKLPSLVDIAQGRVDPVHLSLLFDCAVTAYRDAAENEI